MLYKYIYLYLIFGKISNTNPFLFYNLNIYINITSYAPWLLSYLYKYNFKNINKLKYNIYPLLKAHECYSKTLIIYYNLGN